MAELQKKLQEKYRNMFSMDRIVIDNDNNFIITDDVINDIMYVNNDYKCNDVYVNKDIKIASDATINNISLNNIFVNNDIYTNNIKTNNLNINNNCTVNNDFYCKGTYNSTNITCNNNSNNNISCNNISLNNILSHGQANALTTLTIESNNIDINSSNIIFNGTIMNILNDQINIKDKNIISNISNSSELYHGINILGISGSGFIRINDEVKRFQTKAPIASDVNYIVEIDKNEDMYISGTSNINNMTVLSNINISDVMVVDNDLYVTTGLVNNTDLTVISAYIDTISISNNCKLGNDMYSVNITNNNIVCNNMTANGPINISGSAHILNLTTNNISCNNIIANDFTINNIINVNDCISTNNLTIASDLYINANSNVHDNVTCNNLSVCGDININHSVTVPTFMSVSGNANIGSNSLLNNVNINGTIIMKLPDYDNNYHAALNGINIWELYRTGAIVKVRLDIVAPVLYLEGATTINHDNSNFTKYTEPGVTALDEEDGQLPVYIVSIMDVANVNYLSSPILYENPGDITINTITSGDYLITYESTDIIGNVGSITRTLRV